jgi:hypothetical protein
MGCRYKYHLVLLFVFLISPNSYSQLADTVKVVTQTPDGKGQPGIEVVLDDHAGLRYDQQTDSLGTVVFTSVPTPVEDQKNPLILKGYDLKPSYPNPTKDHAVTLRYQVPTAAVSTNVKVTVYDILGRKVKELVNTEMGSGVWETAWDLKNERGQNVADGVYVYALQTDDGMIANKMLVLGSNGPALPQTINKKVGSAPDGKKLAKTEGKDYTLTLTDGQGRFETPPEENVTIEGDTTFIRTVYELLQNAAPGSLQRNEGETVGVAKNWFQFTTGLDTLINNSDQWKVVGSDKDSVYFATVDSSANGSIPLILKAKAIYGTEKDVEIPVNIADIVSWKGIFVDDMKYKGLLDIIEGGAGSPAEIYVNGQVFKADGNGNFSFRLPAAAAYIVQVQGKDSSGNSTTFMPTFQIQGTDQDSLILHAMPYWPLQQLGLTPQDGYDFAFEANFAPGPGANYAGLKEQDWNNAEHGIYEYGPYQDTFSSEEMQYLASVIADSFNVRQQIPIKIVQHFLPDSADINNSDGDIFWLKDSKGPLGSFSADDYDLNGIMDRAIITVRGGEFHYIAAILQEGATAIYGPWPVNNFKMYRKSVISEGDNPGYVTIADDWLLRLVENYPVLSNIDMILGGDRVSSLMNVQLLNKLMDRIELDPKNYKLYKQDFFQNVKSLK